MSKLEKEYKSEDECKTKPCPWCGSQDLSAEYFNDMARVACRKCGAKGPAVVKVYCQTQENKRPWDAWNFRHGAQ